MMTLAVPLLVAATLLGDPETFLLRTGEHFRAEVLEVDGQRVHFRVHFASGYYGTWKTLADFTPHCAYHILRTQADENDSQAHLRLARFAADQNLVYVAQRELGQARELAGDQALAPELEREISERGATVLRDLFRAELEQGRLSTARRYLSELLIRYPDTQPAARKEELLAEFDAAELRVEEERVRARQAREAESERRQRESRLEPVRKRLETARENNRQGLLHSKSFSTAHGLFLKAIRSFELVARDAEKLTMRYGDDEALVEEAVSLHQRALTGLQDALLNAASMSLVRGQFTQAMGHVNKVLALDPENGQARALRARIEIAANQYGYGI